MQATGVAHTTLQWEGGAVSGGGGCFHSSLRETLLYKLQILLSFFKAVENGNLILKIQVYNGNGNYVIVLFVICCN